MRKITFIIITSIIVSCGTLRKLSTDELIILSEKQVKNKEWNKAEKTLTELIERYPNETYYLFERGYVKEKNLKYKECIIDFTKVILLEPNKPNSHTNRGFAFRKTGKYKKAIKDFTSELKVNPNPYSYEHRGMVHYLMGNYEEALKDVNISIEKEPSNSISYKTRALIYMALNQKENSCSNKEKAIELKLLKQYPSFKKDINKLNKYCEK